MSCRLHFYLNVYSFVLNYEFNHLYLCRCALFIFVEHKLIKIPNISTTSFVGHSQRRAANPTRSRPVTITWTAPRSHAVNRRLRPRSAIPTRVPMTATRFPTTRTCTTAPTPTVLTRARQRSWPRSCRTGPSRQPSPSTPTFPATGRAFTSMCLALSWVDTPSRFLAGELTRAPSTGWLPTRGMKVSVGFVWFCFVYSGGL